MASITAKFTKVYSTEDNDLFGQNDFIAGTGNLKCSSRVTARSGYFYGLNFEELRGKNFTVTDFKIDITGGRYNTSYGSSTKCNIQLYESNGSITNEKSAFRGDIPTTTVTSISANDWSNTDIVAWMNSNKDALLNGYTTRSFQLRISLLYAQIINIECTLYYEFEKFTITANSSTGGTVTGGGSYESGTTATLTATPNTGYKFKQWSDGDTSNPRTVTVTGNATYTAQFEKLTYTVSVAASPSAGGTVSGGGTYEHGSTATLTATPNAAHNFKQWSDGNTNNPRTVTVTANATYTAVFEKKTFSITATASPPEGGTVTGGGVYEYSSMATLRAIPNEGYKFTQWSTGVLGNPYSITVFSDTEIVAYFEKEQTSNIFVGTQRVTAYCGTQKMSVYCGTKKMS